MTTRKNKLESYKGGKKQREATENRIYRDKHRRGKENNWQRKENNKTRRTNRSRDRCFQKYADTRKYSNKRQEEPDKRRADKTKNRKQNFKRRTITKAEMSTTETTRRIRNT